jgi:glycosyltransferase involved in cell wall biosynthesis
LTANKKIILQINKAYWPHIGGVETVVRDIAEQDFDEKYRSDVLTCNIPKGPTLIEYFGNIKVMRQGTLITLKSNPFSLSFIYKFFKLSKSYKIFHLHEPFPLASLIAWLLPPKTKLVVTWHSDIIRQNFLKYLVIPFQFLTLLRANSIIATSESMKIKSFIKLFRKKVIVIPLSIPDSRISPSKVDKNYFLYIGRLVYYKGIFDLLNAVKNSKIPVKIVGDGVLFSDIAKFIKKNDMTNVNLIKGPVDKKAFIRYLSFCSALVFPSNESSEAFGIVQLEAMCLGKPVINTKLNTGVSEVSINKLTGITVSPNSPQELLNAINFLHNNKALREKYGNNAIKRVASNFVHSKTIPTLINVYQNLLKNN